MAPLIILLVSFCLLWGLNVYIFKRSLSNARIGCISMGIMLLFTGAAHFFKTGEMVAMMPDFIPFKTEIVYLTGLLEIGAALSLIFQIKARLVSMLLIVFFFAVLPANIVGSMKQIALGGMEYGTAYLYFRIPFQLLLIWWVYYFGIKTNKTESYGTHGLRSQNN